MMIELFWIGSIEIDPLLAAFFCGAAIVAYLIKRAHDQNALEIDVKLKQGKRI